MSDVRFTTQQTKVIETHNRNLLISAAAGSGKTAVLVERIIRMIMNPDHPVSIDRLLVVTFTNAAASEMRERVGNALYIEIEKDPTNIFLQHQLTLLPSATIMTLHAFCLKVIKNYFYKIDLDPSFRIGDETELTLMRNEVLQEVLESYYEETDEDFIELIEAYAPGKSDVAIEELVQSVYKLSRSHPTPSLWLDQSLGLLKFETIEDWYESDYVAYMVEEIVQQVQGLMARVSEGKTLIDFDERLKPMLDTIAHYEVYLLDIMAYKDNREVLFEIIGSMEFPRAKSAKRGTDSEIVDPVRAVLVDLKDQLKALQEAYGSSYDQRFLDRMATSHDHMKTLIGLIKRFATSYQVKKSEQYLIDFNDIEHFALDILLEEDGQLSEVAHLYGDQFDEILVDEYQDSNLVQETLIQSVSKVHRGEPNIFMVGDMKQSIYKFRLAKPELFANKYDTYSSEDSQYQKIELHQNFRSRQEILGFTNYIFTQIMSRKMGDVTYDESAALNQGARYAIDSEHYATDVVLVDRDSFNGKNAREIEAIATVNEIERLMTLEPPMMVYDKNEGGERQLSYKDIVILLRTMSGWSEVFVEIFNQYGIPVASHLSTGYFDTIEIQTVLNTLRVIDNPKQDIPLLAVLRSPMFDFTSDELVTIRLVEKNVDYHSALQLFYESALHQSELDYKVERFMTYLSHWRSLRNTASIYELVKKIYEDTSYYDYVSLMIGGSKRQANLDMFLDQVYRYEKTSYKGLFNFIRFMEHVKKHSIDQGEALTFEDQGDQVTIMSIHGSKGLEFPVVVIPGLNKQFNKSDLKQSVLLHQDFGFGTDTILTEDRVKIESPIKKVLKSKMDQELKSEELRVLYVALTRAREKLILIGSVKSLDVQIDKWCKVLTIPTTYIGYLTLKDCRSYLDWLMLALLRHKNSQELYANTGHTYGSTIQLQEMEPALNLYRKSADDYELSRLKKDDVDGNTTSGSTLTVEDFNAKMIWTYPGKALTQLHISQSVSELKRLEQAQETVMTHPTETIAYRPVFITGEQPLTGAERGTIYHKVMYHIDFTQEISLQSLKDLVAHLIVSRVITRKEGGIIDPMNLLAFLESTVGQRALSAAKRDQLFKEKPFVMGIKPSEYEKVLEETNSGHMMIQGVIDLYFEEEDGLVIVDYKTDYLVGKPIELLIERYEKQMAYYKRALEQGSGIKVKEIVLYAVSLQKTVEVPLDRA